MEREEVQALFSPHFRFLTLAKVEEAKLISVSITDIGAIKDVRDTRAWLAIASRA